MAVKVVYLSLVGIPENLIGLGRRLELLFRLLITRIAVRVVSEGHLPICLFYLLFGGVPGNTQDFIIILFSHNSVSISDVMLGIYYNNR